MAEINVGDLVTLTATFSTVATGAAINPSTVVITVRDPFGQQTTPAVTNPSTGVFQATVGITAGGTWEWRATGTGSAQAQDWSSFFVPSPTF